MNKIIASLIKQDENSKAKSIISLLVWLLALIITVCIAEKISYQNFLETSSNVIDPLSGGFLFSSILAIIFFLPLISFSYHHAKCTDNSFLLKVVKHLWICNLVFVAIACFVILAEISKKCGFV